MGADHKGFGDLSRLVQWPIAGARREAGRHPCARRQQAGGAALAYDRPGALDARVKPKGNAIIITKQASGIRQDRSPDGGVQCHRTNVDEPLVVAAERASVSLSSRPMRRE